MQRWIATAVGGLAVAAVVAVVALGNDPSDPTDPHTGQSQFDIAVQDPTLVAEGEQLYQSSCAACHGTDLRGTPAGPSHLSIVYNPDHHPDEAFYLAAINGVRAHHFGFGDMPPVPGLTQGDLERIVAYVREHQRVEGFEAYPPD